MPTPDVHPNTLELMRRMRAPPTSHARFVGKAIDPTTIDALALGDLWAIAHATEIHGDRFPLPTLAAETARMIRALGQDRDPVFRGTACRDYLEHLADDAEAERRKLVAGRADCNASIFPVFERDKDINCSFRQWPKHQKSR